MRALLKFFLVCLAMLFSSFSYSDDVVFDCPDDKFNRVVVGLYENIKDDDKFDSESLCIPDGVNKKAFFIKRLIEIKSADAVFDLYASDFFSPSAFYRENEMNIGSYMVMVLAMNLNLVGGVSRVYDDYEYDKNIISLIVDFINEGVSMSYIYSDYGPISFDHKLLGLIGDKYEFTIDEIEKVVGDPYRVMNSSKRNLFEYVVSVVCDNNRFDRDIFSVVENIRNINLDVSSLSHSSLVYDSSFFMGANHIARSMGGLSYSEECVRLFYGKIK